jgi:simple sugar transport system ATP-binding protein
LPEEIGFIPDDRLEQALIGHFSILENIALGLINNSYFRLGPLVLWGKIAEYVQDLISSFGIKSEGPHEKVGYLSGGNQQKVVLARELERSQQLLVARNPTQGLDVKASKFFYQQMSKLLGRARSNVEDSRGGVVLISSDLDEILTFADEIHVLYDGELMQVPTELASRELVGRMMLTGKTEFGSLAMEEGDGNAR